MFGLTWFFVSDIVNLYDIWYAYRKGEIMTYDVIYIGSGHAAWHGAQELARAVKGCLDWTRKSVGNVY